MTTERLVTEYTADTRKFRRGAQAYDRTLARQERLTNDRLGRIDARWERSTRNILSARTAISGLGVALAANEARRYAEDWRNVERRLASIKVTSKEAKQELVDLALRTRSSAGAMASAIQRMAKSTDGDFGRASRRVETLQKLLAFGGAGAGERNSVSLQLGQALKSGRLSGDEFRAISESAPVELLDALAKSAGIARSELKAFAQDQNLTTDIVLDALDGLAKTADRNFADMAISGQEAFDVLQTGMTAFIGRTDASLGATAAFNQGIVRMGEFMAQDGEAAETLAASIRLIGTVALTTAGARGVGALNNVIKAGAEGRRQAVTAALAESRASKQAVIDARAEVVARQAVRREKDLEFQRRVFNDRAEARARAQRKAAIAAEASALNKLRAAEARATQSTAALTAAQRQLSAATRLSAGALRAFRGVLAFFGGPLGVAITALAALPLILKDVDDKLASLEDAGRGADDAMGKFADAAERAAKEQKGLRGEISKTTKEMVNQSRVALRDAQDQLQREQSRLLADIRGNGILQVSDISGPLQRLSDVNFGTPGPRGDGSGGGLNNPFVSRAIGQLQALQEGQADLQQVAAALNDVRAAGQEALEIYMAYTSALADQSGVEEARQALIEYARQAGIFGDELRALEDARGPTAQAAAFSALATRIFDAGQASEIFGDQSVRSLSRMISAAAENELRLKRNQAALEGNTEEVARLDAMLAIAAGTAADLAETPPPDYSAAADSAADLAEQLGISLDLARRLSAILPGGGGGVVFDPRDPRFDPDRARLGRIAEEMERLRKEAKRTSRQEFSPIKLPGRSGGGGGGGSLSGAGAADAERDLSDARGLLLENGRKALFIEQELNAEREKLQALLPDLIALGLSEADAEAVLNSELERTEERLRRVQTASEKAATTFARGILSDIRHAESLSDVIGSIGNRLLDLALDPVFDALARQFATIVTGGGGGGILGSFFGALFNEKGNAFGPSGLIPFAKGGVVNQPTFFGFGQNRTGVLGEAGPEAILPLSRGRGGKLGVVAELPAVPTAPSGGLQTVSNFTWSGDMIINSESDQPQEIGREATDQMRALFNQMFNKQISDAMRGGGVLNSAFQRKAGA